MFESSLEVPAAHRGGRVASLPEAPKSRAWESLEAIAAGNGNLWLLLIGIPAAFVVFHMMFSKELVGQPAARIRSCGEEKIARAEALRRARLPHYGRQ